MDRERELTLLQIQTELIQIPIRRQPEQTRVPMQDALSWEERGESYSAAESLDGKYTSPPCSRNSLLFSCMPASAAA